MKKVLNKTLISLILCCMLIACTVLFVSCGEKKTGYDLTQIDEEYKSIKYQNISVDANTNQIIISYSDLLLESGEAYLQSLINNTQTAYSIINNYNAMVQNSVKFATIYIDACSNAKNVNTNLANRTKADLDSLNTSLNNLNKDIIILADRINFVKTTGGDETDEECLSRLE